MGKYFGTDGFRGKVNADLNAVHAFKIGEYLGSVATQTHLPEVGPRASIVIGKDTRFSGSMYESALAAGITSQGADAYLLDVVTTPGVAYLTRNGAFAFGVMISASHNPYTDNGIKVLNAQGEKANDQLIDAIENYLDGTPAQLPAIDGSKVGQTIDYSDARIEYARFLMSCLRTKDYLEGAGKTANNPFAGYKVGLDCANGSAFDLAPHIFNLLGAEVHTMATEPDGTNINRNCGSTHIDALCAFVRDNGLDVGFAYDGDADRCLAVDATGALVDGDKIMYAAGAYLKKHNRLTTNTVVSTVMSNIGLRKALDALHIDNVQTAVGDRYVFENMAEHNHMVGGEQSGHIIFREFATTGDGILTSLMVMEMMLVEERTLAELVAPITTFPQVLKNVRVVNKEETLNDPRIQAAINNAGKALGNDGRILVRKSGTEPLIRVMAEAPTQEACEQHVDAIIAVMRECGFVVD